MWYNIAVFVFGTLITAIPIDWKWSKEHSWKNIFLIVFFVFALIFGVLGIVGQNNKSLSVDREHKLERLKDSIIRTVEQKHQLFHIDSMVRIHRKDSSIIAKYNIIRGNNINAKNVGIQNVGDVGDKYTTNNYTEKPIRRLQDGEGLKISNRIYEVAKENNIKSVNRVVVQFNYKDGVRTPIDKNNLATDIASYLTNNHFKIDFEAASMMMVPFPDTAYTIVVYSPNTVWVRVWEHH